ncbi:MAG: hypothetical protein JHC93_05985 [Parachlamydiales bacterium]|nr:hypothetical protein [Parachlamydiales bacterium]
MRWHLSKRIKPTVMCNLEGLMKKRRRSHCKTSSENVPEKSPQSSLRRAKKRGRPSEP